MNLILFDAAELDEQSRLILDDRRGHHVCRVLRAAPGHRVRVGMVRGALGVGEVIAIDGERVELAVTLGDAMPARPRVDLILAVPRPKALPRLIQAAATMGVGRIDLVNAWRVDKSYLDAHQVEPASLAHHARLGCEQGTSTWVPEVTVHRLLMPFLEEIAARRHAAAHADIALIAHPRAAVPLEAAVPPGSQGQVALAVGPEGGWIEREIESFVELGFVAVTCMDSVLRVDTAVAALLAQLALLRRLEHPG
ncbi:MAG TPA: RsmE family RNA methyltransferase [Haliangium sp.]|nr:RsmE family RNA methyltransferase [Haliangium sp.]